MKWTVVIQYTEPSYDAQHGSNPFPRLWVLEVDARTHALACEYARSAFTRLADLSSVGWVRVIQRVSATPSLAPGED